MNRPLFFILLSFIFVLLALLLVRVLRRGRGDLGERLEVYAGLPELAKRQVFRPRYAWISRMRVRLNAALSAFASEDLALQLMSANWPITASEYVLIRVLLVAAGFILGWLLSTSPFGGLGLAVILYLSQGLYLRNSINRRRNRFQKQLVDVLVLITGAVRAGFSLLQSMEVVEREMPPPVSEEFHRVLREVGLGRTLIQAMVDMARRLDNRDLDMLVTAITIQYQVGGNLTLMLESVTETIRERIRLFGEVRVLTTQQRFAALILSLLPVFVVGIIFVINPEYMIRLFQGPYLIIPIISGILVLMGFIIIQRMAKIDI